MKFYIASIFAFVFGLAVLSGCTNSTEVTKNPAPSASAPADSIEPADKPNGTATTGAAAELEKSRAETDETLITVYKSPTCGCCSMWETHLEKNGFKVTSKPVDNLTEVRKDLGVPPKMESCHTGVIKGYLIEGHVPADDIKKLLKAKPAEIAGLAAPGMPIKSPGMQPEGEKPSGYDVLSFDKNGNSEVYTSYK